MTTRTDHNIGTPATKAARRIGMAAFSGLALLAVAGCAEQGTFRPGCPNVGILRDAGTVRIDAPGGGAIAFMSSLPAVCAYDSAGVALSSVLVIEGRQSSGSSATTAPVEYFVAVLDPDRNVLAKRVYSTSVDISGGTGTVQERLSQFIPVPPTADGRWYEVLVGFQLPSEQVDVNRQVNESRR